MNDLNKTIYNQFDCRHRGISNIVSREELCATFGVDDRKIREIIVEIVKEYNLPIIPKKKKHKKDTSGYYVAENSEEVGSAITFLTKYIGSIVAHIEALKEIKVELEGQTNTFGKQGLMAEAERIGLRMRK